MSSLSGKALTRQKITSSDLSFQQQILTVFYGEGFWDECLQILFKQFMKDNTKQHVIECYQEYLFYRGYPSLINDDRSYTADEKRDTIKKITAFFNSTTIDFGSLFGWTNPNRSFIDVMEEKHNTNFWIEQFKDFIECYPQYHSNEKEFIAMTGLIEMFFRVQYKLMGFILALTHDHPDFAKEKITFILKDMIAYYTPSKNMVKSARSTDNP
jgi:hypothetical protein